MRKNNIKSERKIRFFSRWILLNNLSIGESIGPIYQAQKRDTFICHSRSRLRFPHSEVCDQLHETGVPYEVPLYCCHWTWIHDQGILVQCHKVVVPPYRFFQGWEGEDHKDLHMNPGDRYYNLLLLFPCHLSFGMLL